MANNPARANVSPGGSPGVPSRLNDLSPIRERYAAAWRRNLAFAALAIEIVIIAVIISARLH
jgi:hypothetical protein